MVRVIRATSDDDRGAIFLRVGDEIFEFARLVAAERETGAVVSLDEDTRPTERGTEERRLFERRREMREPNAR